MNKNLNVLDLMQVKEVREVNQKVLLAFLLLQ